MVSGSPKSPGIFLSSICRDNFSEVRKEIKARFCEAIWVDELDYQSNPRPGDLAIVDRLIQKIRDTNIFLVLLGEDHGTLIQPFENEETKASVSFFEIELYQAVLLRKRIYVFLKKDSSFRPRLESLLKILAFSLPQDSFIEWDKTSDLLKKIQSVDSAYKNSMESKISIPPWLSRTYIFKLVQKLFLDFRQ